VADHDARLADFLANPRETRDIELKQWLDISEPAKRAKVGRHLMAIANCGGGWLQFGFRELENGSFEHEGAACPDESRYSTDAINAIVKHHSKPHFHCEVYWQECDEDCPGPHALIRVPGLHKVPIVCAKGGPDPTNDPEKGAVYDRLPGPESSRITEPSDWHALLERCIQARSDDLLEGVRSAVELLGRQGLTEALGATPNPGRPTAAPTSDGPPPATTDPAAELKDWTNASKLRLDGLLESEEEYRDLYRDGWWSFSYAVDPAPMPPIELGELRAVVQEVVGTETGWPAWWWPTSDPERSPRVVGDVIECWMRGGTFRDAAHADFWRASALGQLYLLRGYDEDSASERSPVHSNVAPGQLLDPGIVVWRVGECILHAERMCRRLDSQRVNFDVRWEGLKGRSIGTLDPMRRRHSSGPSQQPSTESSISVKAEVISSTLPDLVDALTKSLFVQFDFFEMPMQSIERELDRMRGRSRD
jgi:hypothetical protein